MTADLGDGCTDRHTGTSAAQPLVSGFIALALEAKYVSLPKLLAQVCSEMLFLKMSETPLEKVFVGIINGRCLIKSRKIEIKGTLSTAFSRKHRDCCFVFLT